MQAFTQAITLLHNLTKEALAAQGGVLTQQGQQFMRQDKKIEDLQDAVSVLKMRSMISDLDTALVTRGQGGAQAAAGAQGAAGAQAAASGALLPAAPTPGDGPPQSAPAAAATAAPSSAPPPSPSSSNRVATGGKDSTKSKT